VKKEQNGRKSLRRLNPQWVVTPVEEEEERKRSWSFLKLLLRRKTMKVTNRVSACRQRIEA
jgi:hypothetical protein